MGNQRLGRESGGGPTLLAHDYMEDIAEGKRSRAYLLVYFRLMRSDGKTLADDGGQPNPIATGSPGGASGIDPDTKRQGQSGPTTNT